MLSILNLLLAAVPLVKNKTYEITYSMLSIMGWSLVMMLLTMIQSAMTTSIMYEYILSLLMGFYTAAFTLSTLTLALIPALYFIQPIQIDTCSFSDMQCVSGPVDMDLKEE